MDLPVNPPVKPMLAKALKAIPDGDLSFEPKWDGFRCIVFRDGDELELEVPNRYYSDWVRDNYQQIFMEELARAFGKPLRLRFTVESER